MKQLKEELQAEIALLEARIEERRREAECKEEELSRCVDAVVTSRALVKNTEVTPARFESSFVVLLVYTLFSYLYVLINPGTSEY